MPPIQDSAWVTSKILTSLKKHKASSACSVMYVFIQHKKGLKKGFYGCLCVVVRLKRRRSVILLKKKKLGIEKIKRIIIINIIREVARKYYERFHI